MGFWGKTAVEQRRIERLIDNLPDGAWDLGLSEVEEMLVVDAHQRRKLKYIPPISKHFLENSKIYFPTDIETRIPPHWKTAPTIFRVDIATGKILTNRLNEIEGCFAYGKDTGL